MTEKEVRQWLGRARTIEREIKTLEAAKQEARDMLTNTTQNYSGDGAQSTKNPHKFDRLVQLEDQYDQMIEELRRTQAEILAAINQLQDGRQRIILENYYIRCMTQEEIAVEMHFAFRTVKRHLKAGILEVGKLALFGPR